jgi:threonine dehydrogenase-like Zn-dependent dehydrogenase
MVRGASRVYIIDHVQQYLDLATSIGALPINFHDSDLIARILDGDPSGVRRSVDAVDFQAETASGEINSGIALRHMVNVTARGDGSGAVGLFDNILSDFNYGEAYEKSSVVNGDIVLPSQVASELVSWTACGQAQPVFVVSSVIDSEDAPEYYAKFSKCGETKVVV